MKWSHIFGSNRLIIYHHNSFLLCFIIFLQTSHIENPLKIQFIMYKKADKFNTNHMSNNNQITININKYILCFRFSSHPHFTKNVDFLAHNLRKYDSAILIQKNELIDALPVCNK